MSRVERMKRWIVRAMMALPLLAIPGPCTTFDGETAGTPAIDAAPETTTDASTADVVPLGPKPYLSLADAAKACSLVARCPTLPISIGLSIGVPVAPDQFAHCVHFLASPIPPSRSGFELQRGVLEKIAAAKDCKEALDATPNEFLYGADPRCADAGNGSTCYDDSHTIFCTDAGYGTFSTCGPSRGGSKCSELTIPDAGTYGVCNKGNCQANVPDTSCEGTVLHTCDPRGSKLESVFDCGWVGLACALGPEGYSTCLNPIDTSKCSDFGASTCATGDRALFCLAGEGRNWSSFACAEVNARCARGLGATNLPFCLHNQSECSPLDPWVGTCTGNAISLCVDGKRTSFDCASIGKQCEVSRAACL